MNWFRNLFRVRPPQTNSRPVKRPPRAELIRPDQAPAPSAPPSAPPTDAQVTASEPTKTNADDVLHRPLLEKLATFKRRSLRSGQIVFHGCALSSEYTDVAARRLGGTRKWVSEDASYACDYGGAFNRRPGDTGHLWICRIRQDLPAFVGRQSSLIPHSPWDGGFPWKFPDAFQRYAQAILDVTGPVALLDHQEDTSFGEILITSPGLALEVIDVITLPDDLDDARVLGRKLNEHYAAFMPSREILLAQE